MQLRFRDTWTAWLLLAVSLLLTLLATVAAGQNIRYQAAERFNDHVGTMQRAIERRMGSYIDMLLATRGLVAVGVTLDPPAWQTYVAALNLPQRFPGIQGMALAHQVPARSLADYEARQRSDARPHFTVFPRGADVYVPVSFIAPLNPRNGAALGFDLASEPVRRAALNGARDTGEPALTGRLTLRQEISPDKQAGFLVCVPIYAPNRPTGTVAERRAAVWGYVSGVFRADDLFAGIFGGQEDGELSYTLYDGSAASDNQILTSAHMQASAGPTPRFTSHTRLVMAGRPWLLVVHSPPGFSLGLSEGVPFFVFLGGLAFSLLLFSHAWILATARQRAVALAEGMTSELRLADRAKDEFLSVISHELRTPLNFIMGFASILEDEVPGPLNPTQKNHLQKIMLGSDRMLALVNDLLDFAKIQAGKFELSHDEVVLAPLVGEVVAASEPLAAAQGLSLVLLPGEPVVLWGDEARIVQILTNLIGNAIKFTPKGGCVTVSWRREASRVHVAVQDTGIGIAAEDVPLLFTRFKQLDMSATRHAGGTGLGLSITKGLVEAHGGQIGVESELGVGSTFWFEIGLKA